MEKARTEGEILNTNQKNSTPPNPRLGKVGGQAVMEGVMMRSPKTTAIAVRRMDDGQIVVRSHSTKTVRDRYKFLNLPIIRGVVNLVEMFILSFSTLTASTEMLGLEEELQNEEPSKFDAWLERHFGKNILSVVSAVAVVLGVALALGLFVALPAGVTNLLFPNHIEGVWECSVDSDLMEDATALLTFEDGTMKFSLKGEEEVSLLEAPYTYKGGELYLHGSEDGIPVTIKNNKLSLGDDSDQTYTRVGGTWRNYLKCLIEGILKVMIFIAYLYLTSLMKEIKCVYQYHGAEHKSIFCYEAGLELTVENVKKQSRFHPRCGTSFMFVMVLLSILVSILFIPNVWGWLRIFLKLLLLPVCVGLGYEFIRYAGKHDNVVTRVLSKPGLWMQRITTREPDDSMMEVAIVAVKSALREEFPDFEVPYEETYLERKQALENQETQEEQTDDAAGVSERAAGASEGSES